MVDEVERNVVSLSYVPSSGPRGVGGFYDLYCSLSVVLGDQMEEDEVQVGKVKNCV
jgi:hypothetical protein